MSPGSSVTLGEWTRSRVKGAAGISPRVACRRLLCFVRPSSERARQAVRQDCSFAKKQESPLALLVVVRSRRLASVAGDDCIRLDSTARASAQALLTGTARRVMTPIAASAAAPTDAMTIAASSPIRQGEGRVAAAGRRRDGAARRDASAWRGRVAPAGPVGDHDPSPRQPGSSRSSGWCAGSRSTSSASAPAAAGDASAVPCSTPSRPRCRTTVLCRSRCCIRHERPGVVPSEAGQA